MMPAQLQLFRGTNVHFSYIRGEMTHGDYAQVLWLSTMLS